MLVRRSPPREFLASKDLTDVLCLQKTYERSCGQRRPWKTLLFIRDLPTILYKTFKTSSVSRRPWKVRLFVCFCPQKTFKRSPDFQSLTEILYLEKNSERSCGKRRPWKSHLFLALGILKNIFKKFTWKNIHIKSMFFF